MNDHLIVALQVIRPEAFNRAIKQMDIQGIYDNPVSRYILMRHFEIVSTLKFSVVFSEAFKPYVIDLVKLEIIRESIKKHKNQYHWAKRYKRFEDARKEAEQHNAFVDMERELLKPLKQLKKLYKKHNHYIN